MRPVRRPVVAARGLVAVAATSAALLLQPLPARAAAAPPADTPAQATDQALLDLARQPWRGDWDAIVQRRVLRVLVAYNRTLYFVDRGTQRGVNYEVFKAFEDEVNRKLQTKALHFHVAFIPASRQDLIPALREGRGDLIAANLTITGARDRLVDFSAPVLGGIKELLVTGAGAPAVHELADLSGRTLYIRRSSSYWEHVEALNARLAAAGKPAVRLLPASENLEDEDLLEMLDAGLIPGTVVDSYKATLWAPVLPRVTVHEDIVLNADGQIAWAIRQGSPQLKAVLDDFIRTHGKGTLFGNTVIHHYWQSARTLRDATADSELRKFHDTVDLFRKYASRYDMDYLLMMAQGYQESRLDQQARSAVGAVGIMQVMPDTGRSLGVGDVAELEPNIHAGVKYIRYVIDNFYAKEPMSALDRTLFAFASYNAGPGRIQSLRREAARRGLDPNVWFGNVEFVTAEAIGQETATYVANIYKYYVAYALVADAEQRNREARDAIAGRPAGGAGPTH
jgi:membrane-bound lytic murein transglycosylase MltF